jgi:hypothetical protein
MIYHYPFISIRVAAAMSVAFFFFSPLQAGTQKEYCQSSTGNVGNGYHYEYWTAGSGSACMTVYGVDAKFKANWSSSGDFLARVGLRYNETKTPSQLGIFSSEFAYTGSASSGLTYIGIYGWTNSPLVEYYIIEDWYSQWTTAPSIGTKKGTFTLDSGTYAIYQNQRTGQSIHGNTTFTQYYSIRQKGRKSGHISISKHFAKWDSLGLQMGKLYEVKLLVEGMNNGSGDVDFTKATVVLGDPTSVSFVPVTSREQRPFFENNNARGVLSLISLNGTVVRSVRLNGPESAFRSTGNLASGIYIHQFQGGGNAPVTRALLLK